MLIRYITEVLFVTVGGLEMKEGYPCLYVPKPKGYYKGPLCDPTESEMENDEGLKMEKVTSRKKRKQHEFIKPVSDSDDDDVPLIL